MKILRRIIIWSLIAISLQICVFTYVNNNFFKPITKFKKVKISEKKEVKKINIEIPDGASNIDSSFDGKYLSYLKDGQIYVVNTEDEKSNVVKAEDNCSISYYKWLPDSEYFVMVEDSTEWGKRANFNFFNYNPTKNEKNKLEDLHNVLTKIPIPDKNSSIQDIALSTKTHTMYVKLSQGKQGSMIYRINVMNQVEKIKNTYYSLGNITVLPHDDVLIYGDNGKIRNKDTGAAINFSDYAKREVLGSDTGDILYVGDIDENGKVTKIHYGKISDDISNWKTTEMSSPQNISDLCINFAGGILINDESKSTVTNIINGKEYKYEGKLIKAYDNGFMSMLNGKLIKKLNNQ